MNLANVRRWTWKEALFALAFAALLFSAVSATVSVLRGASGSRPCVTCQPGCLCPRLGADRCYCPR